MTLVVMSSGPTAATVDSLSGFVSLSKRKVASPLYLRSSSSSKFSVRASMQRQGFVKRTNKVIKNVVTGIASVLVCTVIAVVATPSFLSWSQGLNVVLWVTNQAIPGELKVRKASLGWTKPVLLQDISLKDASGESVLLVEKVSTKASLFSLLTGRSGFGDCTIEMLRINLLPDAGTGFPRLALALERAHKLQGRQRQSPKKQQVQQDPATVKFSLNIKAMKGGLQMDKGEMMLPADTAAVLGDKVFVEVLLGKHATNANDQLVSSRLIPLQATLWSECAQAEAAGFANLTARNIELLKPIKVEMGLTPQLGRIYLSRVNPLLGYIVGPAVSDEDMPDVVLTVSPRDMKFPAEQYGLRFEPLKVVLARGPIIDGLLSLLSKEDSASKSRKINMETSAIQAVADTDAGILTCSRIDLLIAGSVHVATWGQVDWIEEQVKMMLGVPSSTLKDLLGFQKLPHSFHLQIPIGGTFDRPQIDLKAAGKGIAQLTLHERGGNLARGLLGPLDESRAPSPVDVLPWENKLNFDN